MLTNERGLPFLYAVKPLEKLDISHIRFFLTAGSARGNSRSFWRKRSSPSAFTRSQSLKKDGILVSDGQPIFAKKKRRLN